MPEGATKVGEKVPLTPGGTPERDRLTIDPAYPFKPRTVRSTVAFPPGAVPVREGLASRTKSGCGVRV